MKFICFLILIYSVCILASENDSGSYRYSESQKQAIFTNAVKIAAEHGGAFHVSPKAIPPYQYSSQVDYEEYRKETCAEIRKQIRWREKNQHSGLTTSLNAADRVQLPKEVDRRADDVVTPVRNQGQCGSCWAFALLACMETAVAINCGKLEDLSEQDLMNCNPNGDNCYGGYVSDLELYRTQGAVLEVDEPYQAAAGTCRDNPRQYKISSWREYMFDQNSVCVYGPDGLAEDTVEDMDTIVKESIIKYGSCFVTTTIDDSFKAYSD
ncbi:MAG: C1 family peptidase, partial [Candidatus Wallbacteria bacterium]|nr:C1 family peptidase [Candidatus Wallbacteria bacterium]